MNTDVLIIGGGLAGRMAAYEAVKSGASVLLLQDGAGASPWVHGINAPVHPGDSPEVYFEDTMKSGQGLNDPRLARALCGDAAEILSELEGMGLCFNRENGNYQLLRPLGASFPRVVSIGNETGPAVLTALRRETKGNYTEISNARALRLFMAGGRVTGALVYDTRSESFFPVSARATVLACGGYCGIYPFSTNKRDSGGDGAAMAYGAGAALCDMEFIQFEPAGAVWPESLLGTSVITTMFYDGAVLRGAEGDRFMLQYGKEAECVSKDVLSRCIAAQIMSGGGTPHGGVWFDATGVGREKLAGTYPAYLARYARAGIDLCKEWIEIAPSAHTSLGGVMISPEGETASHGLFACGEAVGGLHGANRIGGSAGLETLVFGKRAGRAAADYAGGPFGGEYIPSPGCGSGAEEAMRGLRTEMRSLLGSAAGVLRSGDALQSAVSRFAQMESEAHALSVRDNRELFLRLRLENDLTAARLTAAAALCRDESAGCHTRTDRPLRAPDNYRVVLRKGTDGETVSKERIGG